MAELSTDETMAESLASAMIAMSAQSWPINLYRLAALMGVDDIRSSPMVESGRLLQDDRTTILLNEGMSPQRRRFVLAHELAHLAVRSRIAGPLTYGRLDGVAEERLCDSIAAALLLPRDIVEHFIECRPMHLNTIRDLAYESGASLPAASRRVAEVKRCWLLLVYAHWTQRSWQVDEVFGGSSAFQSLTIPVQTALAKLAASRQRTFDAEIELGVGPHHIVGTGQAHYSFGNLTCLLSRLRPANASRTALKPRHDSRAHRPG